MEVKMTRVLEKCLLCLMADISTMWISRFFVTTACVYSMLSDRFFLPWTFVSLYQVSISFFQGSGEQSQELYTFHEAVSQLQDAEDKLMDDDRNNIEVSLLLTPLKPNETDVSYSVSFQKLVWDWIWKFPYWWRSSTEIHVAPLIGCYLRLQIHNREAINQRRYIDLWRVMSSVWNFSAGPVLDVWVIEVKWGRRRDGGLCLITLVSIPAPPLLLPSPPLLWYTELYHFIRFDAV